VAELGTEMQNRDQTRHELRNLLAVALANVEAMLDGLVGATPARLESLADALRRARDLLERSETI